MNVGHSFVITGSPEITPCIDEQKNRALAYTVASFFTNSFDVELQRQSNLVEIAFLDT
jgi:hypothetical protein